MCHKYVMEMVKITLRHSVTQTKRRWYVQKNALRQLLNLVRHGKYNAFHINL